VPTKSLAYYASQFQERDHAMAAAYLSTAYTMAEIADHFGVSTQTVSRAVKRGEIFCGG
jgi:putative transposase